jgi:hypothetical protein
MYFIYEIIDGKKIVKQCSSSEFSITVDGVEEDSISTTEKNCACEMEYNSTTKKFSEQ